MNIQEEKCSGYQLLSGIVLVFMFIGLFVGTPHLQSIATLVHLLEKKTYLLFALLGMVFVQASGSVDFSCVTQTMMISSLLFVMADGEIGVAMACFFCVMIGAGMGAVRGMTIGDGGLTSTAACIWTLIVYYGVWMLLGDGGSSATILAVLHVVMNARIFGVSAMFLVAVLVLIVVDVFFNHTYWGKEILSAKLAPEVVERAGIDLRKIVIYTSAACGALMSISAITYVADIGRIQAENGIEILAQTMGITHLSGASMSPKPKGLRKLRTLRVLAALMLLVMLEECLRTYAVPEGTLFVIYGVVSGISLLSSKAATRRRGNKGLYLRP